MANTSAPFGFQHTGQVGGGAPTFQTNVRLVAAADTNKIGYGDAVMPVTSSATGYVTAMTAGTVQCAGIAYGCKYFSTSQQKPVYAPNWNGADATGDVTLFVVDDPNALFRVQADTTGLPFSKVGQNVQVTPGTVSATGQSTAMVTGANTTSTLPFRLVGVVTDPPGQNGTDATTGFNIVVVTFNNESFKQLTAVS